MTLVRFTNPKTAGKSFNNFMDDLFTIRPSLYRDDIRSQKFFVPVNVSENSGEYILEVVAPGFDREDFKIALQDNLLTISAENKPEATNENGKQILKEYTFHSFSRSFTLNDQVDDQKIVAKYINGVLTLNLPKKVEVKPPVKEITVQ